MTKEFFIKSFSDTLKTKDRDLLPMPALTVELIEALDVRFKEQSADIQWSDREIFYKSGQRSVVKFLMQEFKEQQENK